MARDTKGMIRQHQFHKVELVSIVENHNCIDELERMTNCAMMILDELKLPYRKIILSTGDMGLVQKKHMILKYGYHQKILIEKYLVVHRVVRSNQQE